MIKRNPFDCIERFKIENQKRGIPTAKEVKSLLELEWNNTAGKLAFKLAALCGLRAGEISSLQVCDIDLCLGKIFNCLMKASIKFYKHYAIIF